MNCKKTLILTIIYALVIVAEVVSICFANISGLGFGDVTTLTVINDYQMTFEKFDDYIDSTIVAEFDKADAKFDNRQIVFDNTDHYSIVVYDFPNLSAEAQTELSTVLDAQEGNMSYSFTKSMSDANYKTLYMTAIIVGVVMVLQFVYFVIFGKTIGRVLTAVASTLVLLLNVVVSSAVICILGLVGISVSAHAIATPLIVVFLTVVLNVVLFERAGKSVGKGDVSLAVVLEDAFKEIKLPLLYASLIGMVGCVLLAAVGSYSMLPLTLAAFFGIMTVLCSTMYIVKPLLVKLRK